MPIILPCQASANTSASSLPVSGFRCADAGSHLVCLTNCLRLRPVRCSGGQQGTSSTQITWLIANGQLEPGDRLPTVRRLAEHLSINLHTVRSAYQKLEMQGLVETRRGRGTHVLSFDPRLVAQAAGPLRSHTVGVIVAGWGNPFYHTFLRGVLAFGALRAIKEPGRRVPDDVVLVGFNDVPLATLVDPPPRPASRTDL
jgi:hypothetical protein